MTPVTLLATTSPPAAPAAGGLDVARVRADVPMFRPRADGGRVPAYLDSAATAQKPQAVLDRTLRFYAEENANVHRGVYALSAIATEAYEGARERVRRFLGAATTREVLFTRGTTEAVNLVAQSWARPHLRAGDVILLTGMEHHSNLVPWQLVAEQTGATLREVPVTDAGELDMEAFHRACTADVKLVGVVHVSNALGTVNPVRAIADAAHAVGAVVLVDAAQSAPHLRLDVASLGADFVAFSGHKVYGPTGIGVLWGREALLEAMPPWQGGGDMIRTVTFERSTWADLPAKFEAGTPNIAGAIGLAAALDWLDGIGIERAAAHEQALLAAATEELLALGGIRLFGTAREKGPVLSFTMDGVHPHDLATVLDEDQVCVRAGHHCTQPLMRRFGVPATARASFGVYNSADDVARLVSGLRRARAIFG
ncbi:MAG: SufS family cysteine desulfurase [Gemmatimonadales bacterium]|nr:SufS family cysteine desulfurase [Gemmatimonadales bacterium]